MGGPSGLRVGIQQPSLPAYRVPVFRALAARDGLDVHLWYGSEAPALANAEPDGFAATFVPARRWPDGARPRLLWHRAHWHLAGRDAADVAVMCWTTRYLSLWPALVRARLTGVPVALWGHGFSKRGETRLRASLRRLPARLARAVIVYDEATRAALVDAGYDPRRVFVASNGLDGRAIAHARRAAEAARGERGDDAGTDGGSTLVYVGRLAPENRLDLAIEALARLVLARPRVRLVVIGGGDPERDRLQGLAERLGVTDRIEWAGPLYDEARVASLMIGADAFVYPCNVGLSLVHAFNYGVPAVVCAPLEAHNPEIGVLSDGVNGRVAAAPDAASLADAIGALLGEIDDPERRARMRAAASDAVAHVHNLDSVVEAFASLARFLATERRRA